MYSYEDRVKAVRLLIQYGGSPTLVIRELGYPSRGMLYNWYNEYLRTGGLHSAEQLKHTKYSKKQRQEAVEYYLEHGRSISRTITALGFPGRTVLRDWLHKDLPLDKHRSHCKTNGYLVRFTPEQKEQAVIDYCAGNKTPTEIAKSYGVSPNTICGWKKKLLSKGCAAMAKEKPTKAISDEKSIDDLHAEKVGLERKVKDLERDIYRLQLERDILEKAGEIIKKDRGISLETLTNQEKAVLIDALRDKYRLKVLITALRISKSSYCYQSKLLRGPNKYEELRSEIRTIFYKVNARYGYRRIYIVLKKNGNPVSEKVIRRIMKEEHIVVPYMKKKKYSSYVG